MATQTLDDLMAEFLRTRSYAGPIRDWREVPATAEDPDDDEEEIRSAKDHKYGNTQLEIDPTSSAAASLNAARAMIHEEDLAGEGKDVDPNHVTVRYGLLNDDLDDLRKFIASQSPFEARVLEVELFPASEHSEGAVPVVARIASPRLRAIEREIGNYAGFKDKSFPVYKPHCTLAYCRPEAASKYANLSVDGTFLVSSITISHKSDRQETIPFGNNIFRAAKTLTKQYGPMTMRFDITSPQAIKWAKEHAAELAVNLSETTKKDIRKAIAESLNLGDNPYDAILDAVGNDMRASLIARTETMAAANEGNRQAWNHAVEKGWIPPDTSKKWIATSGCCDECDELDGESAPLDGQYPDPGGLGPPLHPRCRCTEGLTGDLKTAGQFIEAEHPREPAGSSEGGQFANKIEAQETNPFESLLKSKRLKDWKETQKPDGNVAFTKVSDITLEDQLQVFDTGADLGAIAEHIAAAVPGDVDAEWEISDPEHSMPELKLMVNGHNGIEMVRKFYHEGKEVIAYHDQFEIPESLTGQGIAKKVLDASMEDYKKLGIDAIKTYANLGRGGYAWAKFGFKADDPLALANQLGHRLNTKLLNGDITAAEHTQVSEIIKHWGNDPTLPWHVAGIVDTKGRRIGNIVMSGTAWEGTLSLKDKESMDRFEHYVKEGK